MKLFCILALIAVANATAVLNADIAGRIFNGQAGVEGDDFVIRVLSVENEDTLFAQVSSGAAISQNIGIISGQAVYGFRFWYVGYGSIHVDEQLIQTISEDNIINHPSFDPSTLANNIAVIRFTIPVTNFRPVATSKPQPPILIGFGYGNEDEANTELSSTVQQLILMEIDGDQCESYDDFYRPGSICGFFPAQSSFNYGDQGGPLLDSSRVGINGLISYWGSTTVDPLVAVDVMYYEAFIDVASAELLADK